LLRLHCFRSAGFGLAGLFGSKALKDMSVGQSVAGIVTLPLFLLLKCRFWLFGPSTIKDANELPQLICVCICSMHCSERVVARLLIRMQTLSDKNSEVWVKYHRLFVS
jgi:hypothetical protein